MTKVTPEQISQGLLDARELMNNNGNHWIKGRFSLKRLFARKGKEQYERCYCSIGAIRAARPGPSNQPLRDAMIVQLAEVVAPITYPGSTSFECYAASPSSARGTVMAWNDHPCTTWGGVSRAFRRAARKVTA